MTVPSIEPLINECSRIEENCQYTATAHFISAGYWTRVHLWLGPIPLILGALGGWKGITTGPGTPLHWTVWAAIFSLVGGIFGTVLSFLNLTELKLRHFTAGTQYKSLGNDARQAREIHSIDEDFSSFKKRVVDLGQRYNALGESSIQTSDRAFERARRKVKSGVFVPDFMEAGRIKDHE